MQVVEAYTKKLLQSYSFKLVKLIFSYSWNNTTSFYSDLKFYASNDRIMKKATLKD